mmetsp:Transcript_10719/g.37499  ORF Transcript_10719/g.37499 Transcript_10719/m.37499 type:complete len:380 (-) Transcript_10719:709-1848(-)
MLQGGNMARTRSAKHPSAQRFVISSVLSDAAALVVSKLAAYHSRAPVHVIKTKLQAPQILRKTRGRSRPPTFDAELHHVTILDFVVLAFLLHEPCFAASSLATQSNDVLVGPNVSLLEVFREVRVDCASGLGRPGSLGHEPCPGFLLADGQVRDEAKQALTFSQNTRKGSQTILHTVAFQIFKPKLFIVQLRNLGLERSRYDHATPCGKHTSRWVVAGFASSNCGTQIRGFSFGGFFGASDVRSQTLREGIASSGIFGANIGQYDHGLGCDQLGEEVVTKRHTTDPRQCRARWPTPFQGCKHRLVHWQHLFCLPVVGRPLAKRWQSPRCQFQICDDEFFQDALVLINGIDVDGVVHMHDGGVAKASNHMQHNLHAANLT